MLFININEIYELQINFLLHLSLIVIANRPGVSCSILIDFMAHLVNCHPFGRNQPPPPSRSTPPSPSSLPFPSLPFPSYSSFPYPVYSTHPSILLYPSLSLTPEIMVPNLSPKMFNHVLPHLICPSYHPL